MAVTHGHEAHESVWSVRRDSKPWGEDRGINRRPSRYPAACPSGTGAVPEKVLADVSADSLSHPRRPVRIAEQQAGRRSERPKAGRIGQQDARALGDLAVIPPTAEPMTGRPFHIPSSTVKPEPFRQALLHGDSGVPLQRVDHGRVLIDIVKQITGIARRALPPRAEGPMCRGPWSIACAVVVGWTHCDERARGRRGATDQIRRPRNRDPREAETGPLVDSCRTTSRALTGPFG